MSNYRIFRKTTLACAIMMAVDVSMAEKVTFITIEDVGYGGQNDYNAPSTSFKDDGCTVEPCVGTNNIDGLSGVFSFGGLTGTDTVGNANYYLGTALEDKTNPNTVPLAPGAGFPHPDQRSRVFITDFTPIDTSTAQGIYTFSAGFGFAGYPFYPKTTGPSDIDINYVNGSPSELVVNTLPFAGDYGLDSFLLGPQDADPLVTAAEAAAGGGVEGQPVCGNPAQPHVPLVVRWLNRIGSSDRYNYKMAWTHCITLTENPSGTFDGNRAAWVIEGVMTAPDTTPPTVVSSNPVGGSLSHPPDNSVSVTFSERMDPATIDTTTLTVAPSGGGPSECASVSTSDNITFTCAPNGGTFTGSISYDLIVSTAVTDNPEDNSDTSYATGVALASQFTATFTTAAGADVFPPTLISTSPADAATGVAIDADIDVTFGDDSGSLAAVTSTAIGVTETVSGATVSGGVSTSDNLTFTFAPSSSLLANTGYTVSIDESLVQDGSGNALGSGTTTAAFTTAVQASLPVTPVAGEPVVSVDTTAGASMVSLAVKSTSEVGGTIPDRVVMDDKFVEFTINGVISGQATVTIDFGFDFVTDNKSVYKADGTTYTKLVEGTDYTQVNNTTIQMTILDNGPYDMDPDAGEILDPVGTGFDRGAKPAPTELGCTTIAGTKVAPLDRIDMYLLLGLIAWYGLFRRRRADAR